MIIHLYPLSHNFKIIYIDPHKARLIRQLTALMLVFPSKTSHFLLIPSRSNEHWSRIRRYDVIKTTLKPWDLTTLII